MRIRQITGTVALAAGAALFAVPACALPVVTIDVVATSGAHVATVSFDGGTVFGSAASTQALGGDSYSFVLSVPGGFNLSGGSASFRLPEVSISSAAGWALSDLHTFLGPLTFSEPGSGTTSARINGAVYFSGQPAVLMGSNIAKTITSSAPPGPTLGFYSTELAMHGPFANGKFAGQLTLTATPGSSFAADAAQTPAELRFSFNAVAVPEPGSWAMLVAGLLWVGWTVRRRPAR